MTILILVAALASPVQQAVAIVGLWDSATSSGGIGQTLEFRPDGTFIEATTVIVNLYYRLSGDRLLIGKQPSEPNADFAAAPRIKIDGDILTLTGPDGKTIRKQRLASAAANSGIVGTWQYQHDGGAVAFERYTADGRMFFRLPIASSVGRYRVTGSDLVFVRQNQPESKTTFTLHEDSLEIVNAGRTTQYSRDPGGPWYDREHISRPATK